MKGIFNNLLVLISLSLTQCQDLKNKTIQIAQKRLDDCKQYDYCFKDSLMFYKGNQFELYGKIEDYVKVFGKYDRLVEDLNSGGLKTTYYYFKNEKIGFMTGINPKISMTNIYIDKNGKTVNDNFKNIKEAIKKYGEYDSTRVEVSKRHDVRHYVWDKAGLSAFSTNDTIHDLKLEFIKGISFEGSLNTKEENKKIHDKSIWTPYSGKICFDGNTVNVGMPSPDDWNSSIKKMGISGNEYDPEGNEGSVIRKVIRYYKNRTIQFNIMRQIQSQNKKDMIEYISIGYMKTNDE
jgi:hypothetical protein